MNKWIKVSDYINNISKVKFYLALPNEYGAPVIISGNTGLDYILEHYDAICPIPVDGIDEFRRDTHNYGESKMVPACSLNVGDKIYYNFNVLTVTKINEDSIEFDLQGFIIDNPAIYVEKL